ncbi:hypothetical protein [Ralstonia solanacearum]|uniref:hypothetical protein n=1 Tax=Ralstonia solanacearum TaxID=305 RepID=UPI000A6055E0|nr:hypothetical protein [Ralstonia solanacearum]MCL9824240.1 hypothetical protein [Ralstonia solanacearum]MCL9829458.1 hypothetical protein [Ralstonia solanacearum]MCL9834239.1 hypothetical protein [Ralstonia solanacearum]
MQREDVTDLIVRQKIKKQLSWARLAEIIGHSKEWSTAALLGQMTLTEAQARAVGEALDLPDEAVALLQVVPYKGALPGAVPTDPLIYRFYELQPRIAAMDTQPSTAQPWTSMRTLLESSRSNLCLPSRMREAIDQSAGDYSNAA